MQFSLPKGSFLVLGFAGLCSVLVIAVAVSAAPIWDGGSLVDSSLGTAENWVDDTLPAPTDDVVFTGNVRTDPDTSLVNPTYQSVQFDANASAFVVGGSDTLTIAGFANAVVNNSTATQTFNAPVNLSGASTTNTEIRATSGDLVFNGSLTIGNSSSTRVHADGHTVTVNGNLTSGAGGKSLNIDSGTVIFTADNSATWTTRMGVNYTGVLRFAATGAAGAMNDSTTTAIIVQGGITNPHQGTVELVNGITINKWFELYGRPEERKDTTHIRSIGDNTLQGRLWPNANATTYPYINIDSDSGLLTIESEILQSQSGTRLIRFRGAGNTRIAGTFAGADAAKTWKVAKLGSGTLTCAGAGVNCAGDMAVLGGMLVVVPSGLDEKPTITSPRILVGAGATLDVSALQVGTPDLTLSGTQILRGSGAVVGDIATSSGTRIAPGSTVDDAITTYTAGAGTLSVMGDLDLSSGADMYWNLAALSESNPGTDFDVLAVSGALVLGGSSQLTLDFSVLEEALRPDAPVPDAFWASDRSWKIVDVDDAIGSLTGDFATLANGSFDGVGTFATRVSGNDVFLDFDSVYNPLPPIPGDTDNNRIVDETDAAVVAGNWGQDVGQGGYASGDFDGNGWVNAADAAIQVANWGDHNPPPGEAISGVPEPGVVVLLFGLILAWLPRRIGR